MRSSKPEYLLKFGTFRARVCLKKKKKEKKNARELRNARVPTANVFHTRGDGNGAASLRIFRHKNAPLRETRASARTICFLEKRKAYLILLLLQRCELPSPSSLFFPVPLFPRSETPVGSTQIFMSHSLPGKQLRKKQLRCLVFSNYSISRPSL